MRKAILFVLLLTIMSIYGYTSWDEDGIPIRKSYTLDYSNTIIQLQNGHFFTIWNDDSTGIQEIKIQKTGEDGENIWENPLVLDQNTSGYLDGQNIVETSDNYIVAVWHEYNYPNILKLQKLDSQGNILWGENGIELDMDFYGEEPIDMDLIADNEGGIYITYKHGNIYVLKITPDGSVSEDWNPEGEPLFNLISMSKYSSIIDGDDGIVTAAFSENTNQYYLQRCNSSGVLMWSIYGIPLGYIDELQLFRWSENEVAYVYYSSSQTQLMIDVIDLNGNSVFNEPQVLFEIPEEIENFRYKAIVTSDGKIGIIYTDTHDHWVKAQKITIGDAPEWDEGVIIYENDDFYIWNLSELIADNSGGIYISWREYGITLQRVCIEHVNSEGFIDMNDLEISDTESDYSSTPLLIHEDNSETTICWMEASNETRKVIIQRVDEDGNILFPDNGNIIMEILNGSIRSDVIEYEHNGEYSAICWEDSRRSDSNTLIFTQIINSETGESQFQEQGIMISDNINCEQRNPSLCFNESGNRLCLGYTQRFTNPEDEGATVQIIDLEGNRLLGDYGLSLSNSSNNPYIANIAVASIGDDFLVSWSEHNTENGISTISLHVQKLVNNQPVWDDPVIFLDYELDVLEVVSLKDNFLVWTEESYQNDQKTIKTARINDAGEIEEGWGDTGIAIHHDASTSNVRSLLTENGIVVFWDDSEIQEFQYISNDGAFLWEEGTMFFDVSNCSLEDASIVDEKMICLCVPYNQSASFFLEVDLSEEGGWEEPDVLNYSWIDAHPDNVSMDIWDDLIVVYWENEEENIMASLYDLSGNQLDNIPFGGIEICSYSHEQTQCVSSVDDYGRSIVSWQDFRGSGGKSLFSQMIDLNSVPAADNEIFNDNLIDVRNYPNPFVRNTTLEFELPRDFQNAEVVIYNIRGQKIRNIAVESNKVEWDCKDNNGNYAAAGVYFYRLQSDDLISNTGKMIFVK